MYFPKFVCFVFIILLDVSCSSALKEVKSFEKKQELCCKGRKLYLADDYEKALTKLPGVVCAKYRRCNSKRLKKVYRFIYKGSELVNRQDTYSLKKLLEEIYTGDFYWSIYAYEGFDLSKIVMPTLTFKYENRKEDNREIKYQVYQAIFPFLCNKHVTLSTLTCTLDLMTKSHDGWTSDRNKMPVNFGTSLVKDNKGVEKQEVYISFNFSIDNGDFPHLDKLNKMFKLVEIFSDNLGEVKYLKFQDLDTPSLCFYITKTWGLFSVFEAFPEYYNSDKNIICNNYISYGDRERFVNVKNGFLRADFDIQNLNWVETIK